jgi:N6-adenosine-specific RNA methylase IME4
VPDPFHTIVADPPWDYGNQNLGRRYNGAGEIIMHGTGSEDSYERMSVDDLAALPVGRMAAKDAHLYLWMTNTFIEDAYRIARAWGFRPIVPITWVKLREDGGISRKAGYYFRGATEHVLFCVRGSLRLQVREAIATAFMTDEGLAILGRRLPHSVKPDEFYELVEKASPGPRLELFSRRARPGWDVWGNEVESTVTLHA